MIVRTVGLLRSTIARRLLARIVNRLCRCRVPGLANRQSHNVAQKPALTDAHNYSIHMTTYAPTRPSSDLGPLAQPSGLGPWTKNNPQGPTGRNPPRSIPLVASGPAPVVRQSKRPCNGFISQNTDRFLIYKIPHPLSHAPCQKSFHRRDSRQFSRTAEPSVFCQSRVFSRANLAVAKLQNAAALPAEPLAVFDDQPYRDRRLLLSSGRPYESGTRSSCRGLSFPCAAPHNSA